MTTGPPPGRAVSASSRFSDTPRRHPAGSNPRPPRPAAVADPSSLHRILYYLLLSILCARPLISESFERVELWFLAPAVRDLGPTPATTVFLDALLLAAAAAAFALPGRRHRLEADTTRIGRVGVASVGVLLLAAAAVISTCAAGDKRLAANAGANLLATVLAGMALVRLMSARWMVHLLLAAALATGLATATKCILQKTVEFKKTAAAWEEHKRELARRGEPLDSAMIVNYERRLRSADAFGYLYHPNVTASCLLLVLVTAGGLAGASLARGRHGLVPAGACLLVCALLATGLCLTGSLGGISAAVAGCALLVLLAVVGRRITTGRLLALLGVGYAAIIAAIIAVGLSTGRLPHESLAFRWEYWTSALRVYADAPITGVGRQNFADGYLLYKSAASTEEVKDPHNLWVSLLVELGPLGLTGGILLLGWCLAAGLRCTASESAAPGEAKNLSHDSKEQAGSPYHTRCGTGSKTAYQNPSRQARGGGPVLGAPGSDTGSKSFALVDLVAPPVGVLLAVALCSGTPFDPLALGATWAVGYAIVAWVLEAQACHARGRRWLSAGLTAAMTALLLHALIDFALFTPAGLAAFVTLAAAAGALATEIPADRAAAASRRPAVAAAGATAALLAAHLAVVVVPTVRADLRISAMRRAAEYAAAGGAASEQVLSSAADSARATVAADEWDPYPARAAAESVARLSGLPQLTADAREKLLDLAVACAEEAQHRNARAHSTQNLLASIYELRWSLMRERASGNAALTQLRQAAEHAQRAARLHPTDPRAHILAGRLLRELWSADSGDALAAAAVEHFRAALRIDALRKPDVAVKLGPRERLLIDEALYELETGNRR